MSDNNARLSGLEQNQLPDLVSSVQIENIELIELLGKGGMSLVLKARQKQLDSLVDPDLARNLALLANCYLQEGKWAQAEPR